MALPFNPARQQLLTATGGKDVKAFNAEFKDANNALARFNRSKKKKGKK